MPFSPRTLSGRRLLLLGSALVAALLFRPGIASGQGSELDLEPVTRSFLIRNARIVQAPGQVIERGSVLVRDGVITAVGVDVDAPFDAEIIPGDSLVVYAGLIDGLSHIGVPEPERPSSPPTVPRPGDPPNDVAGIQPDRHVTDLLRAGDRSIAQWRSQGITLTQSVPYGQMLPGTSALLLLSDLPDDAPIDALVFRAPYAAYARFDGVRGIYPATTLGIMAKWRNLYRNAELLKARSDAYTDDPTARARPTYDPVLHAFVPIVEGERPVVFAVETDLEARRATRLSEELGFPLVLAGLKEGAAAQPWIGERAIPTFLSLDLPDAFEPDSTQRASARADSAAAASGRVVRTTSSEDLEAERARLAERREEAVQKVLSTPAAFAAADVPFGFTTLDSSPREFWPSLRRLVEHGLSEDAALAALTTDPAALLGIDASVGSVEPGKLANLLVTSGPLFEENTEIRLVVIDGRRYSISEGRDRDDEESASPAGTGTWTYTLHTPDTPITGRLVLEADDDALSGTIYGSNADDAQPLDDLVREGDTLRFTYTMAVADQTLDVRVTAVLDGDEMDGTGEAEPYGSVTFEAVRRPD